MTEIGVRLSPRAVIALRDYRDNRGLTVDDAVEEMLLRAVAEAPGLPRVESAPTALDFEGKKRRFLELLTQLGSVSEACAAACIAEGLPYGWARSDLEFARAFDATRGELREARRGDRLALV